MGRCDGVVWVVGLANGPLRQQTHRDISPATSPTDKQEPAPATDSRMARQAKERRQAGLTDSLLLPELGNGYQEDRPPEAAYLHRKQKTNENTHNEIYHITLC